MRRILAVALLGAFVSLALPAGFAQSPPANAQAPCLPDTTETKSEVPALSAMHEVIYPLWHEAWPNQNVEMVRELLPQVRERVKAVQAASLPGILRDRKADWDAGVEALAGYAKACEDAVAKGEKQATMDAVEKLHASYERLARVIWPAMRELDDYHVVLYRIYHYAAPAKDLAAIRSGSEELSAKCKALAEAPIPRRFAAKEKEIRAGIAQLWNDTEALRTTAKDGTVEAVTAAVEKVHTQYRALDAVFR